MKTVIIGAGAMGSLFGGLLSEAGADVWLLDVWEEHVQALNREGLSIEWQGKSRRVPVKATTDPDEPGQADLVILFVKSLQTPAAARTAAALLSDHSITLTLQNGMGNADILADAVSGRPVLAGTTAHGATMLEPGTIRHAGKATTYLGGWHGTDHSRAAGVADFLSRNSIETEAVKDIRPIVWHKLLVNIGINAITALTGIKNGQLPDLPQTRELAAAAIEEAAAVARAQDVHITEDIVDQTIAIAHSTGSNRSSMGQDVDSRRQTEIGAINGFIVREGKRLDVQIPVNQTLTTLIETAEAHF